MAKQTHDHLLVTTHQNTKLGGFLAINIRAAGIHFSPRFCFQLVTIDILRIAQVLAHLIVLENEKQKSDLCNLLSAETRLMDNIGMQRADLLLLL